MSRTTITKAVAELNSRKKLAVAETLDCQRTGAQFTARRQDAVHHSALEQPAEVGGRADMRERAFHERTVERDPVQQGGQLWQRARRFPRDRERELLIEVEERNFGQG